MTTIPTTQIASGPFYALSALPSAIDLTSYPETKLPELHTAYSTTAFKKSEARKSGATFGAAARHDSDRFNGASNRGHFTLSPAVQDLLQQLLSVFHSFAGRLIGGNVVYDCGTKADNYAKLNSQIK